MKCVHWFAYCMFKKFCQLFKQRQDFLDIQYCMDTLTVSFTVDNKRHYQSINLFMLLYSLENYCKAYE